MEPADKTFGFFFLPWVSNSAIDTILTVYLSMKNGPITC